MQISRRVVGSMALAAAVTTMGACGASAPGGDSENGVAVSASFYPLQFLAEQVGGDLVTVTNVTPPGVDPHDLELSPAQVRELGEVDLLVHLSGFQPALDEVLEQRPPRAVVDAATVADLSPQTSESDEHDDEDGDEHDDEDGDEHGDGEGKARDPHFWLDPTRLAALAPEIAAELSRIDPENADQYEQNATGLVDRLTALDETFAAELAACQGQTLVTAHEAFDYLADRYDLELVGVAGLDNEADVAPARMREVADLVTERGVSTIFFESLGDTAVIDTLASDAGIQAAELDPLENQTDPDVDYLEAMQNNLTALTSGLDCATS